MGLITNNSKTRTVEFRKDIDQKVKSLLDIGYSRKQIAEKLGITKQYASRVAISLGYRVPNGKPSKYDWDEITEYFNKGHSLKECRDKYGFSNGTLATARRRGDTTIQIRVLRSDNISYYLVENGTNDSAMLKKLLFENGILQNVCSICGQLPIHNGRDLVLQLDHINGIHNDNRINNLRILCPNCHTQTPTYGARNKILKKLLTKKSDGV